MEYDVLFKQLLKTFFRPFMELFFPQVAARIRWDSIEFLDKEEHAQAAEGSDESQAFSRITDVVVKAATLDGNAEEFLIHVEVEHPWRSTFPFRMFEYFVLLWLRHHLSVFPIAICPERRVKPFEVESYREGRFGHETLVYGYFHLGLEGLSVKDWWREDNPVSWAFSAFMEKGERDKVQLMVACFRHIYESTLTEREKILLLDFIRTYYALTPDEDAAFRALLRQETNREVRDMELSYYGKLAQQAKQEGMHLMLSQLLQTKFGQLPQTTVERLKIIQSQEELTALATKVLTANSLAELGLDGAA